MTAIPTERDNPSGLHQRYQIAKLNGEHVDPKATYFVLRLDRFGKDEWHIAACRAAARTYAGCVQSRFTESPHLRRVGEQLQTLVDNFEKADGIGVPKSPGDQIGGYLQVGINNGGEVVINLDYDRTGHINFSPSQARQLATLMMQKADEAEATQ